MGLLVTFILGIFLLAGAWAARVLKDGSRIEQMSIAVAFGTMTALVILELIPEALENLEGEQGLLLPVFAVLGIVCLRVLDHFIPDHDHEHGFSHECSEANVIHLGIVSTVAVTLHNIIEGMTVYSMVEHEFKVGILVALGVGIHNIPMGMVIYTTMRKERKGKKTALLALAALSTFIGGILMCCFWSMISEAVVGALIALTLGMIIYIIFFELVPHLMHSPGKGLSVGGALIGAGIIVVSTLLG